MLNRQRSSSSRNPNRETDGEYERQKRGHMLRALIMMVVIILIGQTVYIVSNGADILQRYAITQVREPAEILKRQTIYVYSMANCADCKVVTDNLHQNGIPFREFYIDMDIQKRADLQIRITQQNVPREKAVMPAVLVNNQLHFGKVSLEEMAIKVKR